MEPAMPLFMLFLITFGTVLAGMMAYRKGLRPWINAGKHPKHLRRLTTMGTMTALLVEVVAAFYLIVKP